MYEHRKVSLQEFGTIELTQLVPDAEIIKKEKALPIQGLEFKHQPNVQTDPEFVTFYADQKGRIRPLASSDIDMYLLQAKQIVNIGNPFEIPGLGKILKNNDGSLRMEPGYYTIPLPLGTNKPPILRERAQAPAMPNIIGESEKTARFSKKQLSQAAILAGAAALIALFVWAIIKFVVPMFGTSAYENTAVTNSVQPDTTLATNTDDAATQPANLIASADTATVRLWKVFLRENMPLPELLKAAERYKSYGMTTTIETTDSVNYNLYLPIQAAEKDTAFKRDSLRRWFARPVRLVPLSP